MTACSDGSLKVGCDVLGQLSGSPLARDTDRFGRCRALCSWESPRQGQSSLKEWGRVKGFWVSFWKLDPVEDGQRGPFLLRADARRRRAGEGGSSSSDPRSGGDRACCGQLQVCLWAGGQPLGTGGAGHPFDARLCRRHGVIGPRPDGLNQGHGSHLEPDWPRSSHPVAPVHPSALAARQRISPSRRP